MIYVIGCVIKNNALLTKKTKYFGSRSGVGWGGEPFKRGSVCTGSVVKVADAASLPRHRSFTICVY